MVMTACPVPGKQKSVDICKAFIAGAPKTAEGYVFYGVTGANRVEWDFAKRMNIPWYYIDNSYFDKVRGLQFRVTKNAVQMKTPREHATDGKRFEALGVRIFWGNGGGAYSLLVEQSPSFMTEVAKERDWLVDHREARRANDTPFEWRAWNPNKPKTAKTLEGALMMAREVVTHSSAAAIEAARYGIPFVVSPMSAIYGMPMGERERVFSVLADNQFTVDEMKKGMAWSWLNQR